MADKPTDLFVGVIDFFAVILPGAIVVAAAYPLLDKYASGLDLFWRIRGDNTAQWVLFIFGSYLAGHLLFLIGAHLDEAIYDPLRRHFKPPDEDDAYGVADRIRKDALLDASDAVNTFQWARSILRVAAPAANAEVERYEADSKFFRSFSVALYALTIISLVRRPPIAGRCAITSALSCEGLTAAIVAGMLLGLLIWGSISRRRRERAYRTLAKKMRQLPATEQKELERPADPPFFYRAVRASAVALLVAIAIGRLWEALLLCVLTFLSFWRYAEQRWKSTHKAYQHVIVLTRAPTLLGAAAERAQREES